MSFTLDKASAIPPYLQILLWLEAEIERGALPEGSRLPPERELSDTLGTARGTVKKAYLELQRRGLVETLRGSGSYVCVGRGEKETQAAVAAVHELVRQLRSRGLSQREVDALLLDGAWGHLPETEKIRAAWVDCSPEMLSATVAELEERCGILVTPFLVSDVLACPGRLAEGQFDLVATTINHFDELSPTIESTPALAGMRFEMVVLTLSRRAVGSIARIRPEDRVAVFYESELFRYSVERYLDEFGVRAACFNVPLQPERGGALEELSGYQVAILPPDPEYHGGLVRELIGRCKSCGVEPLLFEQLADQGSLLHLKEQARRIWLDKAVQTVAP